MIAVEEHVVHGLASRAGGLDGHCQIIFNLFLPDELGQPLRTEFELKGRIVFDRSGRDDALTARIGIGTCCSHCSG